MLDDASGHGVDFTTKSIAGDWQGDCKSNRDFCKCPKRVITDWVDVGPGLAIAGGRKFLQIIAKDSDGRDSFVKLRVRIE